MFPFPEPSLVCIYIEWVRKAFCSLELRVQFCLLVCCTYPSLSTVNKEKNRTDQRASLRMDTRETQQIIWRLRQDHVISTELRDQKFFAFIVSTMVETTELINFLADQIQVQRQQMEQQAQFMDQQSQQHRVEMEQQAQQIERQSQQHKEELQNLLKLLDVQKYGTGEDDSSTHHPQLSTAAIPPFAAFDSTSELWPDYWTRFCTFVVASDVPEQREAQVFLTNQTAAVYKQLANLAAQQTPSKDINNLTMLEIVDFMKEMFNPKLFIVRERFKFWSDMQRKPGETLQELTAACDFPSIKDTQDEALRQRFICSVNSETVFKALFKVKDTELTFARAVEVVIETEDAARVPKDTVYGSKARPVNKVHQNKTEGPQQNHQQSHSKDYPEVLPMWKDPQSNGLPLQRS